MTNKERKKYIVNRCYSAHYAKLPEAFKQINILRYPGLWISILANSELYNIQNLTPECTDVILTTKESGGSYEADYDNLEYTLQVFYELNYFMGKMRFIGDDPLTYGRLNDILKLVLREMRKIKHLEVVTSGNIVPDEATLEVLRNPGMTVVVYNDGEKVEEIKSVFEEKSINYEVVDKPVTCNYTKTTHTLFVEGKIFRCPLTAEKYANGVQVDEKSYVDIVARKLEIRDLRLAMFDITNDPPPENCNECSLAE